MAPLVHDLSARWRHLTGGIPPRRGNRTTITTYYTTAGQGQKENWDAAMRMSSKQFAFWSLVMDLETLQCRFVRFLRKGDFDLYVQVIDKLCGWLSCLTRHSRWLPIHEEDMVELENKHPHVLEEFRKGNFVVQKTEKKFTLIPKDHSHEQNNQALQRCIRSCQSLWYARYNGRTFDGTK